MPKPLPPIVESIVDLLDPMGDVRIKRMFGAFGVYVNELFIGIVDDSVFYLKVDEETKPAFVSRGLKPFTIFHQGRTMEMAYHEAPEEALGSSFKMKPWAQLAMQAAERALAAKKPKRRKDKSAKPV